MNRALQYQPLALSACKAPARFVAGATPRVCLRSLLEAACLGWPRWQRAVRLLARHGRWPLRHAQDWRGRATFLLAAVHVPLLLAALESVLAVSYPAGARRIGRLAGAWRKDWLRAGPPMRSDGDLNATTPQEATRAATAAPERLADALRRKRKKGFVNARLQAEAAALASQGVSFREIGRRLGISGGLANMLARGKYPIPAEAAP